jgi:hypothetical protein
LLLADRRQTLLQTAKPVGVSPKSLHGGQTAATVSDGDRDEQLDSGRSQTPHRTPRDVAGTICSRAADDVCLCACTLFARATSALQSARRAIHLTQVGTDPH